MAAAAEAAAGAVADTAHKVKLINFKGRRVPILLQVSCRGQKTAWCGAARTLLRLLEAPAATPPTAWLPPLAAFVCNPGKYPRREHVCPPRFTLEHPYVFSN